MHSQTVSLRRNRAIDVYRHLKPLNPAFVWESSAQQEKQGFFSFHRPGQFGFIGLAPWCATQVHKGIATSTSISISGQVQTVCEAQEVNPFVLLESRCGTLRQAALALERSTSFMPYAVGFVSYDSCRYLESIEGANAHDLEPDLHFIVCDTILVLDYDLDTITVFAWNRLSTEGAIERAQGVVSFLDEVLCQQPPVWRTSQSQDIVSPDLYFNEDEFVSRVLQGQEYIKAGDIFQVVLSNAYHLPGNFDPSVVYEVLKQTNPSPYHFFLPFGESAFVGASPEVFLRGKTFFDSVSRQATTKIFMRPVAGTFPRSSDPLVDLDLAQQLPLNEKERAEHIMLVDLERNDVGRVSRLGSVTVEDLCSVETYSHVHHLVSQVSGVLDADSSMISALRACFPIGTLAGAPKIRAMEIIAELEEVPRGIFGGSVFMLTTAGDIDSAVAIRGAVITKNGATVKTGAGIVYDSDPSREFNECLWKARALFHALAEAKR